MAVTSSSVPRTKRLVTSLQKDYPQFLFKKGTIEHWSPRSKTITYNPSRSWEELSCGILHELAHALLNHSSYGSDLELLKLESQAWELAARIGRRYKVKIDRDHIQNCLDTYRDWLHRRSTCPNCATHVIQKDAKSYQCFNCQTLWRVSNGRFVRPYRRSVNSEQ